MTGAVCASAVFNAESCGSTNKEAMRLGLAGELGPLWVHASAQNEGRGRDGRAWVSLPGNLHASLLVRFAGPLPNAAQLSLVAGVAVVDAVVAAACRAGVDVGGDEGGDRRLWLKWPNDIMVGAAKCGGILVETSAVARGASIVAVIGVGLNLAVGPDLDERPVVCLRELGMDIGAGEMLAHVDKAMLSRLAQWDRGAGFGEIRSAWLVRAGDIGSPIAVHEGTNVLKGTFEGLSESGHLVVRLESGGLREVVWGDAVFP